MTKTTEALAREAGFYIDLEPTGDIRAFDPTGPIVNPELARFEALVRADEREKAAQLCDTYAAKCPNDDMSDMASSCAAAIRSGGGT